MKRSITRIMLVLAVIIIVGATWYLYPTLPKPISSSSTVPENGYYLKDRPLQRGEGASGPKGGYFIENGAVFFGVAENGAIEPWKTPVDGADPDTLFVFTSGYESDQWAKDKNNAYLSGKEIPGADVATFKLILYKGNGNTAEDSHATYGISESSVSVRSAAVVISPK
jgi:hypothetical protein